MLSPSIPGNDGCRGGYNGHQVINADDTRCQRDIDRVEQTGRSVSRDGRDKISNRTVDSKSSRFMGLKKNTFQRVGSCVIGARAETIITGIAASAGYNLRCLQS
jgi:hypothetical protein